MIYYISKNENFTQLYACTTKVIGSDPKNEGKNKIKQRDPRIRLNARRKNEVRSLPKTLLCSKSIIHIVV